MCFLGPLNYRYLDNYTIKPDNVRYLKLVTSSNFLPFMLNICTELFVLLIMVLIFSVLTSTP